MPHTIPYPIIPAVEVQVAANAPIIKGIEVINGSSARIALVVDERGKMVGSLVDGDVRRALLSGCTLESPVNRAMHPTPLVMPAHSSRQELLESMRLSQVKQIPLLNADGTLAGIATYDSLSGFVAVSRTNPVVIMAGGKGKRLLPLTEHIPKPMVEVGGKPMLEHILEHFVRQGFTEFYFTLNYLGSLIEKHFGDGTKWHCHIHYVYEKEPLGTAGSLSLIDVPFSEPFIVINGDILTDVNFGHLLDYHAVTGNIATVCARAHRIEVPYGVIQIKDGMMQAIVEKPVYEDLVSAGIYVFNPQVLHTIPHSQPIDMPQVLQALVENKQRVGVFPLHEEWADIGRHDDLDQIQRHYSLNGTQ